MLNMYNTTRDFDKVDDSTAVLSVGALEQHGSHLPIGTDIIIAEAIAKMTMYQNWSGSSYDR